MMVFRASTPVRPTAKLFRLAKLYLSILNNDFYDFYDFYRANRSYRRSAGEIAGAVDLAC